MTSWRYSAGTTSCIVHTNKVFCSLGPALPPSHFSVGSPGMKGTGFTNKSLRRSESSPWPSLGTGRASRSSHPTVCFLTGEERGSSSGCRDERLRKTTSLKLCGVRAVCNQSLGGPDLLICFKALELDLRDVILLGSQEKVPGARGEVLPQK